MEVNSVLAGIQNSYMTSTKKVETKAVVNTELSEAEKLEAFKKEIWKEIDSWPRCSSINWSIQITDGGFKRMMEDPEYKKKVMAVLSEDASVGRPPITSSMCIIDEKGLTGCAYMFGYGEEVFEIHSNDKNSFYSKKATKKTDYQKLWEEQRLKREQQKKRVDKEYMDSLIEKRILSSKDNFLRIYENATIVEK